MTQEKRTGEVDMQDMGETAEMSVPSPQAEVTEGTTESVAVQETARLVKELEEMKQLVEDLRGKWLRAVADLQNAKKRHEKERAEWVRSANESLILKLLPILDDFGLAFENLPPERTAEEEKWIEGFRLIDKKLGTLLESEGVKPIETKGQEFDHNLHEAVSYEPADGCREGEIIAELRKGYTMGDKVIRPALVRVAREE